MVVRDVVTNFFRRIGMVGAVVLASALIFGAVAGGVFVHRLDTTPSASSEQDQGAEAGDQKQENTEKAEKAEKADKDEKGNGHGQAMKKKHSNNSTPKHSPQPEDSEDKDA